MWYTALLQVRLAGTFPLMLVSQVKKINEMQTVEFLIYILIYDSLSTLASRLVCKPKGWLNFFSAFSVFEPFVFWGLRHTQVKGNDQRA